MGIEPVIENPLVKIGFLELQSVCIKSTIADNTKTAPECIELLIEYAHNEALQLKDVVCNIENCPIIKRYKDL